MLRHNSGADSLMKLRPNCFWKSIYSLHRHLHLRYRTALHSARNMGPREDLPICRQEQKIRTEARQGGPKSLTRSGSTSLGGKTGVRNEDGVRRTGPQADSRLSDLTLCRLGFLLSYRRRLARLHFVWCLSGDLRFFLGRELLLDLGRDCGHVHLV